MIENLVDDTTISAKELQDSKDKLDQHRQHNRERIAKNGRKRDEERARWQASRAQYEEERVLLKERWGEEDKQRRREQEVERKRRLTEVQQGISRPRITLSTGPTSIGQNTAQGLVPIQVQRIVVGMEDHKPTRQKQFVAQCWFPPMEIERRKQEFTERCSQEFKMGLALISPEMQAMMARKAGAS